MNGIIRITLNEDDEEDIDIAVAGAGSDSSGAFKAAATTGSAVVRSSCAWFSSPSTAKTGDADATQAVTVGTTSMTA